MAHHHHPEGDTVEDLVDAWQGYEHDDSSHTHKASFVHGDGSYSYKHHHHDPVTRIPFAHIHRVTDGDGGHRHTTPNGLSSAANHEHPRP